MITINKAGEKMTYIKLEDDGRLVATRMDTIRRGDNMTKQITFLIPVKYGEIDIVNATVFLSYIRMNGDPDIIVLEPDDEMYNEEYYQFRIPVTCKLTRHFGEVIMWLQICAGFPEKMEVAKTGDCRIYIHNSTNLDECMSDCQLTALYGLKKQVDRLAEKEEEWEDMQEEADEDGDAVWEDM